MPDTVEIGLGRSARRGYHLDEVALVPTRRTRGASVVSTTWQIDANSFDLPLVAAPSDAVVSPETAALIESPRRPRRARRGGPVDALRGRRRTASRNSVGASSTRRTLQAAYATPVSPDLLRRADRRATGDRRGDRRSALPAAHRRTRAPRPRGRRRPTRRAGYGHLGRARRKYRGREGRRYRTKPQDVYR